MLFSRALNARVGEPRSCSEVDSGVAAVTMTTASLEVRDVNRDSV
jgi:hypothetical protein